MQGSALVTSSQAGSPEAPRSWLPSRACASDRASISACAEEQRLVVAADLDLRQGDDADRGGRGDARPRGRREHRAGADVGVHQAARQPGEPGRDRGRRQKPAAVALEHHGGERPASRRKIVPRESQHETHARLRRCKNRRRSIRPRQKVGQLDMQCVTHTSILASRRARVTASDASIRSPCGKLMVCKLLGAGFGSFVMGV